MNILKFHNHFLTNNPQIDQQHKNLFELLDSSYFKDSKTSKTLGALALFSAERFKKEEELMKKFQYPNIREHLKFHEDFALEFSSAIEAIENNQSISNETAQSLLKRLITEHIIKDDINLFKWLTQSNHSCNLIFKTCPFCQTSWNKLDDFLKDKSLIFEGYQPDFEKSSQGLLLFTHQSETCCTTMSISIESLFSLENFKIEDAHFTPGGDDCPGHCLQTKNLQSCNNMQCKGRQTRQLIIRMIERKNELMKEK